MTQWIVVLNTGAQTLPYGPFDDETLAGRFAEFLTAEIDPARVQHLRSPVAEQLAFWVSRLAADPQRPNNWPPRPGTVWQDRSGDRWICTRTPSKTPYLVCISRQGDDNAEEIWRQHGPLTCVCDIAPTKTEAEECPF